MFNAKRSDSYLLPISTVYIDYLFLLPASITDSTASDTAYHLAAEFWVLTRFFLVNLKLNRGASINTGQRWWHTMNRPAAFCRDSHTQFSAAAPSSESISMGADTGSSELSS